MQVRKVRYDYTRVHNTRIIIIINLLSTTEGQSCHPHRPVPIYTLTSICTLDIINS